MKPFSNYFSYNSYNGDKISNFPWINLKLNIESRTALLKDLNTKLPYIIIIYYTTVTASDFLLAGLTNSV